MRGWMGTFLGFVAACGAMNAQHSVAFPEFHRKLTNGVTLILLPDATASLVEVDVRYEVGSREDPPGKAGLAHLVEHLMFQQRQAGRDKPPIIAVFREYAAYTNAYTNWDSTHYQTLAKAERAEDLVALEVARLETGCQTIDAETFAREREVVRNEVRTRLGTAEAQVDYVLLEAVYPPGHPYRQHIGGDDQQLASITLDDVCKFMANYYVPERATFIVAGGVDVDVEKRLLPMLGPLPPRRGAPRAVVPPIKLARDTVTHEMDVEETSVFATWALPARSTDDWQAAMDFVGQLEGRAAALGDIYEFATDVSVQVIGGAEAPVLAVQLSVAGPDEVDEAIAALRQAARGLRKYQFEGSELTNHRARLSGAAMYQLDGLSRRAEVFADFAQFRGYKYTMSDEVERANRYDPARISSIGRDILDPDKARLVVVRPKKGVPPRLRRAALSFAAKNNSEPDDLPVDRSEAARPIAVPARPTLAAQSSTFTLENGMRVVLVPSKQQLPLVTVALNFRSGTAQDPADREGIAATALYGMQSPHGWFELGYVGASVARSVDADSTCLYVRGLSLYIDKLLLGIERWAAIGSYWQGAIEAWARRVGFALKRPSLRSERAFGGIWRKAVFGDHPYSRDGEPTQHSLTEIGHDALLGFKDRHYVARNATLVVVGSFDVAHATSLIRARFGDYREGSAAPPLPAVPPRAAGARFVGVVGEHLEMVPVAIGYRVDKPVDKSYAARLVLAEMLSHRVRVVREKLAASYGVYASLLTYDGAGAFVIQGSVDPERAGESLRTLREAVGSLRRGEGFVEEFVRARRRVLDVRIAGTTSTLELALHAIWNDRYAKPIGFENTIVSEVAELTPQAVMAVMAAEIVPDREVVVLLGKRSVLAAAFAQAGIDAAQITKEP